MLVGTAGHIDHGKTTLVKALTGVDCDRLQEEKARGITLDLGYAYADDGALGFVDVPGHERLVHNMLAGATGIDFLLLVIAADDGPMPQTHEHLAIASLLGIPRAAIALTKTDAVTVERAATARQEIAALLDNTPYVDAPLFAVAAPSGQGIDELRGHLQAAARDTAARSPTGGFRLAIDRAFVLQGIGLVVTGTAHAGRVAVGDTLRLSPGGASMRVRSLRVHDRAAEYGQAGQRIALNLVGEANRDQVQRGMWLTAPRLHQPVQRIQVRLTAIHALRHWQPVHVHLGADDIPGRLALLDTDRAAAGNTHLAELLLDRPAATLAHDRFVLRDQSATHTVGGGIVLDIFPPTRHKRSTERLRHLHLLADTDPRPALEDALQNNPQGVDLGGYALARNLDHDAAQSLYAALRLIQVADGDQMLGFAATTWSGLRERLLSAAAAEHVRAPDMPGIEYDRLRRLTLPTLVRAAFDRMVAELMTEQRLAQSAGWLHLPTHRATLAPGDADLWRLLAPLLQAQPFQPPRVRDVAGSSGIAEDSVRSLMRRLARVGRVYPVAHDHYFTASAVAQLADHVAALCARDRAARAAALRDTIGGGRKVAIHILEFFDRVGYTRRVRDEHVLRQPGLTRHWVLDDETSTS